MKRRGCGGWGTWGRGMWRAREMEGRGRRAVGVEDGGRGGWDVEDRGCGGQGTLRVGDVDS